MKRPRAFVIDGRSGRSPTILPRKRTTSPRRRSSALPLFCSSALPPFVFSKLRRSHIADRICQKDRALLIYESIDRDAGIGLSGIETPRFHMMPSVFEIVINQLHFVSISHDFLFAERFGWPYPKTRQLVDKYTDGILVDVVRCTTVISPPLLDSLPQFDGTAIFQPVGQRGRTASDADDSATFNAQPYVTSICRFPERAIGHIFVNNENPNMYPMEPSDLWEPRSIYPKITLMSELAIGAGRLQRRLYSTSGDYSHFPENEKKARDSEIASILKLHDRLMQHLEEGGL